MYLKLTWFSLSQFNSIFRRELQKASNFFIKTIHGQTVEIFCNIIRVNQWT